MSVGLALGAFGVRCVNLGGLMLGGEDNTPDIGELINQGAPYRALAI